MTKFPPISEEEKLIAGGAPGYMTGFGNHVSTEAVAGGTSAASSQLAAPRPPR